MKIATLAAAGPWVTLATVIGLAGKALLDFRYNEKHRVRFRCGNSEEVKFIRIRIPHPGWPKEFKASHDTRYWVEDSALFGLIKNDRMATKAEGAEIDSLLALKHAHEVKTKRD